VIAFPLLVRKDTFTVAVRAVDNTLLDALPEQAIVRFLPTPYWDKNGDGVMDPADQPLPSLAGAVDLRGSGLPLPLLNQPPTLVFAQSGNDPTVVMTEPETTYTSAAFSWVGSDPDGDQTISRYEIALNDSTDLTRWFYVPGNIKLISLVVPRQRSDSASSEVAADVYSGTYATTRVLLGSISHLKLNSLNTFYIRARDIAGDASGVLSMPSSTGKWYVKKPKGRLLIVTDYILSDSTAALSYYQNLFAQVSGGEFVNSDVLNISRGLTAQSKRESKFGVLVPPYIDPAFISTLHLYDLVLWYTDQFPSLALAQYPLFQYVRDGTNKGKVIFSTSFENSIDPRGALKDFAPIDSVSSVPLSSGLLPRFGDTRIPGGFYLNSDSSDLSDVYPNLQFGAQANYSVFMRPLYRRADAKYIYHMQEDSRVPIRYVYSPTISDLKSITSKGLQSWACGANGVILYTSDGGVTWKRQQSNSALTLNGVQFLDQSTGVTVGDDGTILRTTDGGTTWADHSVVTSEELLSAGFTSPDHGVIVGTNGLLIRTTNGGASWNSPSSRTARSLHSIAMLDANTGIAVGDSGAIIKTTDGGVVWNLAAPITPKNLLSVRFVDNTLVYAVGTNLTILKSTDAGDTWSIIQSSPGGGDFRSVFFSDASNGWISSINGLIYTTNDGGSTWTQHPTILTSVSGQAINDISFTDAANGIGVCTGGIIIKCTDGGLTWDTEPKLPLNVGVIDGAGTDGKRSFVFIGLPLHLLNGNVANAKAFLEKIVLDEFGF
jgi:photosystem II stability/assembly factor-like uncharacterized protein